MGESPVRLATRLRDEAARAGLRKMGEISIRVGRPNQFPAARNFGATTEDGLEILFAPKLALKPPDIINGVVAHELGHAADFLYPAMWTSDRDDGVWKRDSRRHDYVSWQERNYYAVEYAADGIAEAMFGTRIYYRGACRVQSTRPGPGGVRPRPRGLR